VVELNKWNDMAGDDTAYYAFYSVGIKIKRRLANLFEAKQNRIGAVFAKNPIENYIVRRRETGK